jgi:hypothetical protein
MKKLILAILLFSSLAFGQGTLTPMPHLQFLTNTGAVCASCVLYTTNAALTTPLATFSDYALTTPNPTTITLNSAGRPSSSGVEIALYLDPATAYGFILKTSAGATIWTQDSVKSIDALLKENLALTTAGNGAALVAYSQVTGVDRTVKAVLDEMPTLMGEGASGVGSLDDSGYIASACTSHTTLVVGPGIYLIDDDLTIDCTLDFRGGKLLIATGKTITFNQQPIAGDIQIFSFVSTATIVGLLNPKAEWYGSLTQQIVAPGAVSSIAGVAGALTGTYSYVVTFVTSLGETEASAASTPVVVVSKKIDVYDIPVSADPSVTGRNLYRTVAAGTGLKYLVTNILDNSTTTFTDNVADGSLGVAAPAVNSTGGQYAIDGNVLFYGKSNATPSSQIMSVNGSLNVLTCPEYADNAAALAGGLKVGDLYRTTDTLKIVH